MAARQNHPDATTADTDALLHRLRARGRKLGFATVGVTDTDLTAAETYLFDWLADGRHGEMEWMARHGTLRSRPAELEPGTVRVISARMDYLPEPAAEPWSVLADGELGYISRYALGRDYHRLMRRRLQHLARWLEMEAGPLGYRVFTDSAPVMEKPLAEKAGLGWIGKHTNLLSREGGSWFFLGEIYTDLPLPVDEPATAHCGSCRACIDACPTGAITAEGELDARLCISYLTIEHPGPIPEELRPLMGNRIYGCDDCQLVCPFNREANATTEADFHPRQGLDAPRLVKLFAWDEDEFLARTEGSAIRRIGHVRWLRNLAVALGNAPTTSEVVTALRTRTDHPEPLVREHVAWALARHGAA
jgi:epoxyqueuosine reductase